jgi:peroxiredoxin family protein
MKSKKSEIHANLRSILEKTLEEAQREYVLAKESRDSDTKSSAGDKFETGREMMQKEMDKARIEFEEKLREQEEQL